MTIPPLTLQCLDTLVAKGSIRHIPGTLGILDILGIQDTQDILDKIYDYTYRIDFSMLLFLDNPR